MTTRNASPDEERFAFGSNWQQFLELLDEERITAAKRSVQRMLELETLAGRSFLDVGCGSGLFSLAARLLRARVRSVDCDPESVACTSRLRCRFFAHDPEWMIEQASILDDERLRQMATFDIVYAWGVLHHTGAMWQALENAARLVGDAGYLCLSIYNDQGGASRRWRGLKRLYHHSPKPLRLLLVLAVGTFFECRSAMIRTVRLQNPLPFKDWAAKKKDRGMSPWYDLVDWVGGYPFEFAKPEEVFQFVRRRGFKLVYLTTEGSGHGCNEYTFVKERSV